MILPSNKSLTLSELLPRLGALCRGDTQVISSWLHEESNTRWVAFCFITVFVGCGIYGVSIGLWRDPLQACYTGIKFPILAFLTLSLNGLLNGTFAQLLGLNLSFRQTSTLILMSFCIVGLILGSFTPIALFILCNTPSLNSPNAGFAHGVMLLIHVGAISLAGITANLRLFQILHFLSNNTITAKKILFAWLAGNLLLGGQLSWILRPFIGSPQLPVQFFRSDALSGNFFEAVYKTFLRLL